MPKETDITRLEAKVVELENALKALTALKQPVDLSTAEIKAYLKVRDALSCDIFRCEDYPCFTCGRCGAFTRCENWPTRCSRCNVGNFGGGGLTRFTELGG